MKIKHSNITITDASRVATEVVKLKLKLYPNYLDDIKS